MSQCCHVAFLITDFRINLLSLDDLAPAISENSDLEQEVSTANVTFHCRLRGKAYNDCASLRLVVLNPWGTLGMSGDIVGHAWGGGCCWHLGGWQPGTLLCVPHCTGWPRRKECLSFKCQERPGGEILI